MTSAEITDVLWTWTPYLAGGFVWNIVLSILTMAIGTPIGLLLAVMRASHKRAMARAGDLLTGVARNIPTFVMLFYLAYTLPTEVTVFGQTLPVPAWMKASLALAVAVAGFVSDNALPAIRHLRRHDTAAALLFLPAWTNYFLIIVMASSTASVIGVPEIVQRANTIIGAVGGVDIMLWTYLYAMVWFFAFCWPLAMTMQVVRRRLRHRAEALWGKKHPGETLDAATAVDAADAVGDGQTGIVAVSSATAGRLP